MSDGLEVDPVSGGAGPYVSALAVRRAPGAPAPLFNLERLPLAPATFALDLEGVPTAVASAIRRTVTDENWGLALEVPSGSAAGPGEGYIVTASSDPLMRQTFVNNRVGLIPLAPGIPDEIRENLVLNLSIHNKSPLIQHVYSGDFVRVEGPEPERPLFNPTFELAVLQPGHSLELRGVRIRRGFGNAKFNTALRVANFPLDLEQYPDDSVRREDGEHADKSGFVLSSCVANPRRHRVRGMMAATTTRAVEEVRALLVETCATIGDRLRAAEAALAAVEGPAHYAAQTAADGLHEGVLRLAGETDTLGVLITRYAHEMYPSLALVNYDVGAGAGNALKVLVRSEEENPAEVLSTTISALLRVFNAIREEIRSIRVTDTLPWADDVK